MALSAASLARVLPADRPTETAGQKREGKRLLVWLLACYDVQKCNLSMIRSQYNCIKPHRTDKYIYTAAQVIVKLVVSHMTSFFTMYCG